jgi:signal transduction histidine kinase
LSAISEAGRRALTDLRYLLGALDGAGPVDREPETHALPELIARFRDAGQPVKLVEHGEPRPAVSAAKAATYRVVQEALTNALKHAPGERTIVHLHHDEDVTEVEVGTDRPTRPGLGKGSGRGLVGLRERVGVVGGELHAGARPDGGFTVRARIPRGIS